MGRIMKIFALAIGTLALLAPLNAFAGALDDIVTQVPEPATLSLMAIGVAGAFVAARFRKKK